MLPLPEPDETYCVLSPMDCQCRAAANATVANMVRLEEHWCSVTIECDSRYVGRNLCMQRDILALHEADVRNKAAGSAMEAYYQLASLEGRRHYLDLAVAETELSLERARKLRGAGLPVEVDQDEIAAQLADLKDRRLQLLLLRIQLNGQLQKLMGCCISEREFIYPQWDWTVDLAPVDAEAEVQVALPQRYDLRVLGLVLCQLEKSTLRVARAVLGVVDGSLGSVEPTEGWVHKLRCIACSKHEVDVRCRQLAMLYEDVEQSAEAEIKSAVYEVTMQQHRTVLARDSAEQCRERLHGLQAKRDVDDVSAFELGRAQVHLYDAEAKLVEQAALLQVARVKLKRAGAALAAECGLEAKVCNSGCCNGACTHCQVRTCCPGELPCPCKKCERISRK